MQRDERLIDFQENTCKAITHCKETLTIFVIMRRGGGRFSTSMASCCDGELGSLMVESFMAAMVATDCCADECQIFVNKTCFEKARFGR